MNKLVMYFKFSYKFFTAVFIFTTMPFIGLRLLGFELKELPFMFIALVILIKFFLVKSQTSFNLEYIVKSHFNGGLSKQELVNYTADYKNSQDLALLINGVAIFILNILL